MPRDTVVSWRTFVLFLLFPPLALLALVFFPLILLVVLWLYYRGGLDAYWERERETERQSAAPERDPTTDA